MLKFKRKKDNRGFTLIELIIVIAILGILAAILVPSMLGIVNDSRQSVADADARTLYSTAVAAYVKVVSAGADPAAIALDTNVDGSTKFPALLEKINSDLGTGFDVTSKQVFVSAEGVTKVSIVEKNGSTATYPVAPAASASTSSGE